MLELVIDILIFLAMGLWLAGSGFLGYLLADRNDKIAARFQAISIIAWFIVASQLYLF